MKFDLFEMYVQKLLRSFLDFGRKTANSRARTLYFNLKTGVNEGEKREQWKGAKSHGVKEK